MGEMNGLDSAGGLVVSEGHQGGVINHLRQPRCWCIPGKNAMKKIIIPRLDQKLKSHQTKLGQIAPPHFVFL